jgi:hypothetical protein
MELVHPENPGCHLAKPVFDDADISSGKCEHCLAMKFRSKHYRGTK